MKDLETLQHQVELHLLMVAVEEVVLVTKFQVPLVQVQVPQTQVVVEEEIHQRVIQEVIFQVVQV